MLRPPLFVIYRHPLPLLMSIPVERFPRDSESLRVPQGFPQFAHGVSCMSERILLMTFEEECNQDTICGCF